MGDIQNNKARSALARRSWLLLLGAAVGVALILVGNAGLFSGSKTASEGTAAADTEDPVEAYTKRTEERIAALCESVQGVSGVHVIVTLEGDFTYVYATETESSDRDGVSQDKVSYVTVGSGSGESPVVLTRVNPKISGVGIVCQGGGDPVIRRELLSLLEAALGIPTNRIYITEAGQSAADTDRKN